jgi:hypothetical protein
VKSIYYICSQSKILKIMAYGLLKGKRGIIFGALNDMSIAWKVALKAHEEGARFALTNTPVALRLGTLGGAPGRCDKRSGCGGFTAEIHGGFGRQGRFHPAFHRHVAKCTERLAI